MKILAEYCCNSQPVRAEQHRAPEVATDTWNTDHFSMIFHPKMIGEIVGTSHFPYLRIMGTPAI